LFCFVWSSTKYEIQEGLTAEETTKKEPDEKQHMQVSFPHFPPLQFYSLLCENLLTSAFPPLKQMTDARCSRCTEFKVGLREIIHAGHGDRYQVCIFSPEFQMDQCVL
jgi:hypothetical protein